MTMRSAVLATATLLLLTKLADCWSTVRRVRAPGDETNPWVRRAMARWGVTPVVWAVGAIAAAVVVLSALPAFGDEPGWYAGAFVAAGLVVALVQADVAWSNVSGRMGPISRGVSRFHGRF